MVRLGEFSICVERFPKCTYCVSWHLPYFNMPAHFGCKYSTRDHIIEPSRLRSSCTYTFSVTPPRRGLWWKRSHICIRDPRMLYITLILPSMPHLNFIHIIVKIIIYSHYINVWGLSGKYPARTLHHCMDRLNFTKNLVVGFRNFSFYMA